MPITWVPASAPTPTLTVTTGTETYNNVPLTWEAPAGKTLVGATPYKVYVTPEGGVETLAATIGDTSYILTGLSPVTTYAIRISADILAIAEGSVTATTDVPPSVDTSLRSHLYMSFQAGALVSGSASGTTSYAYQQFNIPIKSTNDWQSIQPHMFDILGGTPKVPLGVYAGVCDGNGTPANPGTITWIAGSNLRAPPAGTSDAPGVGPVCDPITVPSVAGKRCIALRIIMPTGAHTGMDIGTDTALMNVGYSLHQQQVANISGTPGITTGWSASTGTGPAILLKIGGLTTPISMLCAIGADDTQGHTGDGPTTSGVRGVFGELTNRWSGAYPNLAIVNLGCSGHNHTQIASRMTAFEDQLDIGGWLYSRGTKNSHNGSYQFTATQYDAMYAALQASGAYIAGKLKTFIPFSPLGASGYAGGWYDNFNYHLADEFVAWPIRIHACRTTTDRDGNIKEIYKGSGWQHVTKQGYADWADEMESWIRLSVSKGIETYTGAGTVFQQTAYYRINTDGISEAQRSFGSTQTFAIVVYNRRAEPLRAIRLHQQNVTSGLANILGGFVGTGSVNTSTFSAASWARISRAGVTSWAQDDAADQFNRAFWYTDEIALPAPLAQGESCVIRLAAAAGNLVTAGVAAARPHYNDILVAGAGQAGDFASTPSLVITNPSSWDSSIAMLPYSIECVHTGAPHKRAAWFGDSVIAGASENAVRDTWHYYANTAMGDCEIVSHGRGGYTVQDFCGVFTGWLSSPASRKFESCILSGWSWNNQDGDATAINATIDAAILAGERAGLRMSIGFPTPSGLVQGGGNGNTAVWDDAKAHHIAQGYRVFDTSPAVRDPASVRNILAANTPDGVHLNATGQQLMGTAVATYKTLIFG